MKSFKKKLTQKGKTIKANKPSTKDIKTIVNKLETGEFPTSPLINPRETPQQRQDRLKNKAISLIEQNSKNNPNTKDQSYEN